MSGSQLFGLFLLMFGIICVTFANTFAERAGDFQRRFFRVELAPQFLRLGYLLGGVVFCFLGGLALAGFLAFGR